MQGSYVSQGQQVQTLQVLVVLALGLFIAHCNDCLGDHHKAVRAMVKSECIKEGAP